jgi:hypothetical protein
VTGLLELIGLILLFGAAPICLWKWWVSIDFDAVAAEPAPTPSLAEPQPVYFYDYEQLAS